MRTTRSNSWGSDIVCTRITIRGRPSFVLRAIRCWNRSAIATTRYLPSRNHSNNEPCKDDYFISRKLFPNVDFYSGIILQAIGIPESAFTTIFALSRTVGWIAQWNEMYREPVKIGRPRQLYVGPGPRRFVELEHRK